MLLKRGANTPLKYPFLRLFSKGIKRDEVMIRRCSYHNSLPSPLHKGRGIKGEGLVNNLYKLLLINSQAKS
jgi:hypothetical protein